MHSKTRAALLTIVLLSIVLFVAFRAWRHVPAKAPSSSEAVNALPGPTVAPAPAPENHAPAVDETGVEPSALPPEVASLLARAEAGDTRAACALGVRLQSCVLADFYTDQMLEGLRESEQAQDAKGDIAGANHTAANLLAGTRIRQQCDGIPASLHRRAFDFMRQAALAGEPEAAIRYSRGTVLMEGSTFGFIRTPRFDLWRREALPLLESRLEAGHPEAVLVMLEARSQGGYLGMLLPYDPIVDQAYRRLARRLFGGHPSLQRFPDVPGLDQGQRQDAEDLASEWHDARFAGRELALEDHLAGLVDSPPDSNANGWPPPRRPRPPCGEPAQENRQ